MAMSEQELIHSNEEMLRNMAKAMGLEIEIKTPQQKKKTQKERKAKKLPKALKPGEPERLFSVLNVKCPTGLRDRVAMQVMYSSGLRISEVCNLSNDDVDLENGYIYILCGKGKKDRTVPIDQETIDWLRRWKAIRPESEYFFCTLKGGKMDTRQLREKVYRTSKKAGVFIRDGRKKKLVRPHTLRHTCFTECLEEGMTVRDIQELAGHEDLKTTSIYLSVRPERLKQKMMERKKAQ